MFDDKVYEKAEILLEEIYKLNNEDQTQEKGSFYLVMRLIINLRISIQEFSKIKAKNRIEGDNDIVTDEDIFFNSQGYALARNLGLAIYLFKEKISFIDACFEFLRVFVPIGMFP